MWISVMQITYPCVVSAGAANLHTTVIDKNGQPKVVSDYATVQGILIGVVAAFVLIITIIGPEYVVLSSIRLTFV